MADATGNQEIIEIVYVARADDAIADAERMRSAINAIKVDIQNLASQSGASFRELAEGMKKAFGSEQMAAVAELRAKMALIRANPMTTDADKALALKPIRAEIDARIAAWREYKQFVNKALEEINAAESRFSKESLARDKERLTQEKALTKEAVAQGNALRKEAAAQEKALMKETAAQGKALLKESIAQEREKAAQKKALIQAEKAALAEYQAAWKQSQKTGDMGVMSAAAQQMGQQIQNLKQQIISYAQQNNVSFGQAAQAIYNNGVVPLNQLKVAYQQLITQQQSAAQAQGGFLSSLKNLGTVAQTFFGFTLATLAVQALRSVTAWFKEAAAAGFEYAQALLRLEASTQILQESGMNISMKETLDLVAKLNKEFPIFTRKQVVEGVGYIQLLSQNLTLTNEQMQNLAEVGGALAVVLGKDLNEASKELALFLSSGYGEALQRAGILASKASVQHELLAMGVKTSYNETDAATRAQAGYNVIMQQSEKIVEKALEMQNNNAFAATKAKNAWQQLKDTIGIRLTPVLTILYKASIKVAEGLLAMNQKWLEFSANLNAGITTIIPRAIEGFKFLGEAAKNVFNPDYNFDEAFARYKKSVEEIYNLKLQKNLQTALPDIFTGFEDSAIGAGSAVEDAAETIGNAVEDLYKNIKDEQEQFAADMIALETDLQRDLEQLDIDANRKRGESWLEYFADIAEIWRKAYDDIVGENIKFQLDLTQLNREYDQKKADAEQKYRDKEYKAEKDFQEKLRRLREEFLFDLEDALRERDARQVLRLIRRFNLEQARLERERESEREDRAREYQRELEDIDNQRAERLQKLNEEHQARLAEIKRQEAIELRELQIKHEAELAEIDRRLAQEKADREARFLQQQEDLKTQFADRIKQIGEQLAEEYGVTKEMLDAIGAAYMATYGPNGVMQQALDYAMAYLAQSLITMSSVAAGFGGYGSTATYPMQGVGTGFNGIPSFAAGATDMMVTSPKIIRVGEIPELVNITPLNRVGSATGEVGDKGGKINIELWLSPDLQARVMDSTLDQVAEIMLQQQRKR